MKAETTEFLRKAREFLRKAEGMLELWPDEAGRAAYFAGFHAAQGLIFERTANPAKTHSGVRSQFARLTKDEPSFDSELRAFLGRAFNMKAAADYETSAATRVTKTQAAAAIQSATSFVECVSLLITRVDPKT